jgi:hypothetical protein
MSISIATRAEIRSQYAGCCGYCGVSETAIGNELEIDHFRPQSQGGDDAPDNLVYACPACNRYKSDYWAAPEAAADQHLLHPQHDDFSLHMAETVSGHLIGLTARGWFHIRWLHLNRPLLVQFRQLRQREQLQTAAQAEAQALTHELQQRVRVLEEELDAVRRLLADLLQSE